MKITKNILGLLFAATVLASCDSSDNTNNDNETTLVRRVIMSTNSLHPEYNTKQIQYYSNNQVIADTSFNHLNEWTSRKISFTTGNVKTFQTLDTNNQVVEHDDYTYDSQGRIISRRRMVPLNLLTVTFTYNSDNSITVNAINALDQTSIYVGTYYKNSDGLVYREVRPTTANPSDTVENILQFNGLKPISVNFGGVNTITFDYYPNPKPSNILKSATQLNNEAVSGLSLLSMGERGNYYFKRNNSNSNGIVYTYQTDFNSDNYIEYVKSTSINTNTDNNLHTTETFYFYE